jgi:hypothetical protein
MWLPTILYLPVLADWHWKVTDFDMHDLESPITLTYLGIAAFLGLLTLASLLMIFVHMFQANVGAFFTSLAMTILFGGLAAAVAFPLWLWKQCITIECGIDPWPIATTYIGLALAGAMFLAIGLFVSSLVTSQMIAALISLFIGVLFIAGQFLPEMDTSSLLYQVVFYFTVPLHFERHFSRGLIDTRQLVLYGSVALFGLFLTVRSLESRRWR